MSLRAPGDKAVITAEDETRIIANAQRRLDEIRHRSFSESQGHVQPLLKDLFSSVANDTPVAEEQPVKRRKKSAEALSQVISKSAWEESEVGYLSPIFIQCTLPHSSLKDDKGNPLTRYSRTNGSSTLFIETPDRYPLPNGEEVFVGGVPFGTIPRMVLLDFASSVKQTGEPYIEVGKGISHYIREHLQMKVTGGKRGTITQIKEQLTRLAHSTFTVLYAPPPEGVAVKTPDKRRGYAFEKISIAKRGAFFEPHTGEWRSVIEFSEGFFELLRETPVPLDLRVIQALRQNLFALDIYCWLAHRLFYLAKPTRIPWLGLKEQFGSSYVETRVFRFHFRKALARALEFYRNARVEDTEAHLILYPSPPAISDKRMLAPY
jgi:hypothetical protein